MAITTRSLPDDFGSLTAMALQLLDAHYRTTAQAAEQEGKYVEIEARNAAQAAAIEVLKG